MEVIKSLLIDYGSDTFAIAISTVILTGLLKIPIKALSQKSNNSKKITRFITFMPIFIVFGLTVVSSLFLKNNIVFDQFFFERWLSSVSLSLAAYAIWEQFVPSSKKILTDAEIKANKELVDELKDRLLNGFSTEVVGTNENTMQAVEQPKEVKVTNHRRIILTNHKKKSN